MVDPPEPSRTYQPTTHNWPRSTMDSIRVSEALDPRSIRGEATIFLVFYPSLHALYQNGFLLKLHLVKFSIKAALCQQFGVGSHLFYFAFVEHYYFIGPLYG